MKGYRRPDGRFGIRNHVLILSTVGCANMMVHKIAAQVPGAVALENSKGCGQVGSGREIMRRCLFNLTLNPNVYGTLIVGLGCETTKPYELADEIRQVSDKPLEVITIQDCGGSVRALERGVEIARKLVEDARHVEREPMELGDLLLGTNCGGSDATSGLAANPVIGVVSDKVVAAGGTVMLGETTELIGTEDILASRAATPEVADDIYTIVHGLEQSFVEAGVDVRGANPSPGNMKGGLSTLEEKALGGISKGGTTPITQVVPYGVRPTESGLTIMDTPGYDIESVSGMTCGGAQVLIFSTGRGTPIGNPLIPVIKVTGNCETYARMSDNIDFDASGAVEGTSTIAVLGDHLYRMLEDVCDGAEPAAERLGFDDFSIFHNQEVWCTCIP